MKTLTEREIKDLLTPRAMPQPPAGLAQRIKSEIPDEIAPAPDVPGTVSMPRSRVWLMAASLVVAVGGGILAYRLMDRLPAPGAAPVQMADAGRRAEAAKADGSSTEISESPRAAAPAAEATASDLGTLRGSVRDTDDAVPAPEAASRRLQEKRLQEKRLQEKQREESLAGLEQELDAMMEKRSRRDRRELTEELVVTSESPVVSEHGLPSPVGQSLRAPDAHPPRPAMKQAAPVLPPPPAPGRAPTEMRAEERPLEAQLEALEMPKPRPAAVPSTGGTAEPNDAPYGDVFFRDSGTNPFIDTEDDRLSTFGLDVDTGSYTIARRYLRDGHLPPREAVRVEEFINYLDYGDSPPAEAEFAIHAEGAPSIYGQSDHYYLLRFNLSGREVSRSERRPALLTFVVDVSGSMRQNNRLGLVKQALALLIDQLRADDRIALVIYGSRGQVLLEPTSDHGAIRRAVERLQVNGSTHVEEGLSLAYELAARHRRPGVINRVILCSDGVANVGNTSAGSILDHIRREADQGIELTTVGFGMGNYNDVLMERLADEGNGRYAYVDTLDEARRIFVENLTGTLQTLAAEARAQVEFNSDLVSRYRLLGYENRDIADHRFRDDTVDAGEIGVGHTVTALYEIKLERKPRPRDEIATLRLRYGSIDRGEMVELDRAVTGADFARRWDDASPALQLTTLVAEFAEILKGSYWAKAGDLDDVFRRAQRVSAKFEGDREVADFVSLVGRAAAAWERESRE